MCVIESFGKQIPDFSKITKKKKRIAINLPAGLSCLMINAAASVGQMFNTVSVSNDKNDVHGCFTNSTSR